VPRNYVRSTIIFVAQKEKSRKPKTGRPKLPEGEARIEMVRARVTPDEMKEIEKAANGSGVSEWARTVMLSAARAQ